MVNSVILGMGHYLPETRLTNEEIVKRYNPFVRYDKDDNPVGEPKILTSEGIFEVTGIKERRIAGNLTSVDLGEKAARIALENSKVLEHVIDGVIVATISSRGNFPSDAVRLQLALNAVRANYCVDLEIQPDSFVFNALSIALDRIEKKDGNYLVVGDETGAYVVNGNNIRGVISNYERLRQRFIGLRDKKEAAEKALLDSKTNPEDLEGIIAANTSCVPSTSFLIARCLGLEDQIKTVIDVAAACAGFTYALDIADGIIKRIGCGRYLVIATETLDGITDYDGKDINLTLFGAGAGAAVLAPTKENRGILEFLPVNNPFDGRIDWILLSRKGYLRMPENKKVYAEASRGMSEDTIGILKRVGWQVSEIDLLNQHQANGRISCNVVERVGINPEKVTNNILGYGNMSCASSAVGLSEAYENGKIGRGNKVVMPTVGSGITRGTIALIA